MSQIDDSAHVDGGPTEPPAATESETEAKEEVESGEPEESARRAPTKKAASRSGTSARSGTSRAKSGASSSAKAGANGKGDATKATGTTRKAGASSRRRAAGLARTGATATEKAEPTGDDPPADEVTDRSVTPTDAPAAEVGTPAAEAGAPVTGPSVAPGAGVPETGPATDQEPGEATAEGGDGPNGPAHDAWLALDDADRPVIDTPPGGSATLEATGGSEPAGEDAAPPRWTGRWTASRAGAADDTGMVTGVPGLGPDWADSATAPEQAEPPPPAAELDPDYLATLPPPPPGPPPAPTVGERLQPLRTGVSNRAAVVSAWAAGLLAGRRRPALPEDAAVGEAPVDAPPEDDAPAVDTLDPTYLATLPPPPVLPPPVGDLDRLEGWKLPDWSVSGTVDEGGDGPVVDLSVSGVNSDRAVITEPTGPEPTGEVTEIDLAPAIETDSGPDTAPVPVIELDETEEPTEGVGTVEPDEVTEPVGAGGPPPPGYLRSRHARRREWRQVERARRHAARHSVRFPIFTRSILLWMILFALTGMSAGGTAALFWTHFNTQIAELQEETRDFDKRSEAAEQRIEGLRNAAVAEIDNRMKELAPALAEPRTVQAGKLLSPYVWFVSTLDENGVASVGTAFSVATDQRSTWLLTSFNTVKAGTVRPAPPIRLRKDPEEVPAELVSWDAANDMALIRMDRGSQPTLEWAPEDVQAKIVGNRLYVVTGFGGAGATLNSAMTVDQNSKGLLHDGRIGTAAQGGPMVTTDGKVVALASLVYQPLGFDPGELHYAPSIRRACDVLLTCTFEARRVRPPAGG